MPINNTSPIDLSFSSEKGLKIEGIDLKVQRPDHSFYKANLALKSAKYEAEGGYLSLDGLDFTLSSTCLSQLSQIGKDLFPHLFADGVTAFLQDVECEGGLSGSLKMNLSPNDTKVRLLLQDGCYKLWGKKCQLKNVVMDFDASQISFRAEYAYNQRPLGIILEIDRNTMNRGRVVVRDLEDRTPDSQNPLLIYWEKDPYQGVVVKQALGKFAGLEFNLSKSKSNAPEGMIAMNGYIRLHNGAKLASILPDGSNSMIAKMDMRRGYELKGRFFFPKSDPASMSFRGLLSGKKLFAMGCELDSLSANVSLTPNRMTFSQFTLTDRAGTLSIPEATLTTDRNERWFANIPKIQVESFRPCLLRREKGSPNCRKLIVEEATLVNFKGYVSDSSTYTATGSLYFENLPRKSFLERTLLLLPAEIIGRIGLNTNVLEPGMGTIEFCLQQGRFYINKLKDVYSEGKRSRFYLANGERDSYVDYEGNLHINVRTKQYNLIFKLVEFGQFSARGTIDKPVYTFQKRADPKRQQNGR
jgi:hypothetical protein